VLLAGFLQLSGSNTMSATKQTDDIAEYVKRKYALVEEAVASALLVPAQPSCQSAAVCCCSFTLIASASTTQCPVMLWCPDRLNCEINAVAIRLVFAADKRVQGMELLRISRRQ
jgi:hypothetical protein